MREVYSARDAKLNRDVELTILGQVLVHDSTRNCLPASRPIRGYAVRRGGFILAGALSVKHSQGIPGNAPF
ncbi:MAG: hypothetical protein JSU96_15000 [Acidobacteriota bacterium]|nr:MAG: hypothetical protein JSU96_15000 [Acidobacteriota bacterium]